MILVLKLLNSLNAYLDELQLELLSHEISVSISSICRTVRRLGFTRKKLKHIVLKHSERDCEFFVDEIINYIHPDMIVWIDETGSDRRESFRRFGYHIRGMTPISYTLKHQGKRLSTVAALPTRGIEDIEIDTGTFNEDSLLKKTSFLSCTFHWNKPLVYTNDRQCIYPLCR